MLLPIHAIELRLNVLRTGWDDKFENRDYRIGYSNFYIMDQVAYEVGRLMCSHYKINYPGDLIVKVLLRKREF